MKDRPVARAQGIVREDVDGDVVIYDTANQVGHCLSLDAAAVWSRCDGNSVTEDIAQAVSQPIESVKLTLGELAEAGLLEQGPLSVREYSRRDVARLGGAAISAPLILSVAIPSAASAASKAANGTTQTAAQCLAPLSTKFVDANCASNTCYYAEGGGTFVRFCAPATCGVFGARCTTYADCCAGAYTTNPQYNQACQSGTCAA